MKKSFSKGLTKEITDRTALIAKSLVIFTKHVSNRLPIRKSVTKLLLTNARHPVGLACMTWTGVSREPASSVMTIIL